jgi:hypothetical protein
MKAITNAWALREVYFDENGEPGMHREPEQAQPLTDEMLLYIYNQLPSWDMDMDKLPRSLREFARAIEAAHGIKEKK